MSRFPDFLIVLSLVVFSTGCARSTGRSLLWLDAGTGDGTTSDSGDASDGGDACGSLLTACNGDCVDLLADPNHCGSCNNACDPDSEVCVNGRCGKDCGELLDCNGSCVDPQSDDQNCGGCGNECGSGSTCENGDCVLHLSGSLSGKLSYPGVTVLIDGDVTVTPYNGSDDLATCDPGETGCLFIEADRIELASGVTINADGAGYGGGGGGGGGPGMTGFGVPCTDHCVQCSYGVGGAGHAGGAAGGPGAGAAATSISGAGGKGGGPFGGSGGGSVSARNSNGATNGKNGSPGGYAAFGTNGDTSTDESLRMGSGGGGGSGGACAYEGDYASVGGSGGGGAGNPGGGYVKLVASGELVLAGRISVKGLSGARGNGQQGTDGFFNAGYTCDLEGSGGAGGDASQSGSSAGAGGVTGYFRGDYNACIQRNCSNSSVQGVAGGRGGNGGAGAGGGVLLKAPTVTVTGSIDARSGSSTSNGGTVKIFYQGQAPDTSAVQAGRVYSHSY